MKKSCFELGAGEILETEIVSIFTSYQIQISNLLQAVPICSLYRKCSLK